MKNESLGQEVAEEMLKISQSKEHYNLFRKASGCSCGPDCNCEAKSCPCAKADKKCDSKCPACKSETELKDKEASPLEEISQLLVQASELLETQELHSYSALTLQTLGSILIEAKKDEEKEEEEEKEDEDDVNDIKFLADELEPMPMEEYLDGLDNDPEYELLNKLMEDDDLRREMDQVALHQRKDKQLEDLDSYLADDFNDARHHKKDMDLEDPDLEGIVSDKTLESHRDLMKLLEQWDEEAAPETVFGEPLTFSDNLRETDLGDPDPTMLPEALPSIHDIHNRPTMHSPHGFDLEQGPLPLKEIFPKSLAFKKLDEWILKNAEDDEDFEDEDDEEEEKDEE